MKRSTMTLLALVFAGCTANPGANPSFGCETDADCDRGVCYRGFCVEGGMDSGVGPACDDSARCFSGEASLRGVGACAEGCLQDVDGTEMCVGEGAPSEETCNEVDDDCDGTTDENFDLLQDRNNCGACGAVCGVGLECCSGRCVDQSGDALNCGACGRDCAEGEGCCGGSCAPLDQPDNCGVCGNACGPGQTCCDGACVNPQTSRDHCMTCGNACDAGEDCCGGTCELEDAPACTACDPTCTGVDTCCFGSCADTDSDPLNCGGCGIACGAGELCCGGSCVANDEANCGMCGRTCGGTELCCGGSCVAEDSRNCSTCGMTCDAGEQCCAGGCVDTRTDELNCGTCGEMCRASEECSNENCCPAGQNFCDGRCRENSNEYCGSGCESCGLLSGCNGTRCVGL